MKKNKFINEAPTISLILIGLAVTGFVIIFLQVALNNEKPENFGVVGDALGGILNPIIAIASALLTFMAFYIQKLANDELKNQFLKQEKSAHNDFLFKNYKERILLIINEVNNFNISFHNGTLISNTLALNDMYAKKYNFIGIQAINLYLIEYFKLKEAKKNIGETELIIEDSYHAILMHINNLITAYYNIHIAVEQCELDETYKIELQELLGYTYYSKFNYFFEFLRTKHLHSKTKAQMKYIFDYYEQLTKR